MAMGPEVEKVIGGVEGMVVGGRGEGVLKMGMRGGGIGCDWGF